MCNKQLSTGEELYIIDENKFVCKEDYLSNSSVAKENSLHSGEGLGPGRLSSSLGQVGSWEGVGVQIPAEAAAHLAFSSFSFSPSSLSHHGQ